MHALDWRERANTPAPAGLVAAGPARHALLAELKRRDAAALQALRVVAAPALWVLLGETAQLPWVDGVRYCAPEAAVPGLWLPTWLAPALPPDLVHGALQRRSGHGTMLLWPAPELVLGLDDAMPLRAPVLAWLAKELG